MEPQHNVETTPPVIMVVDDYMPFVEMVRTTLQDEGYTVWDAHDGQDAQDKLLTNYQEQQRVPDLIIADIMMPVMDGYTFYDQVRRNPYLAHIPFIFLTGKARDKDIRLGKEMGVDDYLCKPCTAEDLLASVHGKLRRVEQQRVLADQYIGPSRRSGSSFNVVLLIFGIILVLAACIAGAAIALSLF